MTVFFGVLEKFLRHHWLVNHKLISNKAFLKKIFDIKNRENTVFYLKQKLLVCNYLITNLFKHLFYMRYKMPGRILVLLAVLNILFCDTSIYGQSTCGEITTTAITPICHNGGCETITASSNVQATSSYSVSTIPYAPYSFTSGTIVPNLIDDQWSDVVSIPFSFCFYGLNNVACVVGSNGQVCFNAGMANNPFDYTIYGPIPANATTANYDAIMGAFHDMDPRFGGTVKYATYGTAPCRAFVVSFDGLPMFVDSVGDCATTDHCTEQIVIYEKSNIIDVYIHRKEFCAAWNNGLGILGVEDYFINGSATTAPGKNATQFNCTDEGYRFTPNGGGVSYVWKDASNTVISTSASVTVCPPTTSTYTVTATTLTGCDTVVLHDTVTVPVFFATTTVTPTSSDICLGDSVLLTASGADSYTWSPTTGLSCSNCATPMAAPTTTTTYRVIGHHIGGCPDDTVYTTVNVFTPPVITSFVPQDDSICFGDCTIIDVYGTPNATVLYLGWTIGSFTLDATGYYPLTVCPGSTTNYTLLYAINGPCATFPSNLVTITVNPLPAASIPPLAYTFCGGNPINIPVTGTPNATVDYYRDAVYIGTVTLDATGNGAITDILTTFLPVTYTYTLGTVTNPATGCIGTGTGTTTVTILPSPTASIGIDQTICSGDNWNPGMPVRVYGSYGATVVYTDYNNIQHTGSIGLGGYFDIIPLPSNINVGPTPLTYTYTLDSAYYPTSPFCGEPLHGSVTLTVNPLPTIVATASLDSICLGTSDTLHATGGTSYSWTPTGSLSCSNCADPIATPVTTTTYTVIGTDSNTCHNTASITITVHPQVITAAPLYLCTGFCDTLHAVGGTSYNWSPSTGLSCTNCANPQACPTVTTTYTITGIDTFGCNDTGHVTVTVFAHPNDSIWMTPNDTICMGDSVHLHIVGATAYSWSPAGTLTCSNCADPIAFPTTTTTYTVIGTGTNGCMDTSEVTITVDTLPVLDTFEIVGQDTFCGTGVVMLHVTGSPNSTVSYNLNNGPTQYVILGPSGDNTIFVGPVNTTTVITATSVMFNTFPFCQLATNMKDTIHILPVPTITFNPHDTLWCGNSSGSMTLHPITTNAVTYSWTSNPPSVFCTTCSNPTVNPLVTTTYICTVSANNGCPTATDSIKVIVPTNACACQVFCNQVPIVLGGNGVINQDIGNGSYYIDNNATVTGGFHVFTDAKILINDDVTLTVDPITKLQLVTSHLFGCDSMWNGIVLARGLNSGGFPVSGRIQVLKESLIEDAHIAILADSPVTPAGYTPLDPFGTDLIYTLNSTFNRNGIGIKISHYTSADSGLSIIYPFYMGSTVFTSRRLNIGAVSTNCTQNYPYYWPPTVGPGGLMNAYTPPPPYNQYRPPYNIDNLTGSILGTQYVVQPCKNAQAAIAGIVLDTVGARDTTLDPSWYPGVVVSGYSVIFGSTNVTFNAPNLYDHMGYGIYAVNSNLHCGGNEIMYMLHPQTGIYAPGCTGIYSNVTDNTYHYQLALGGSVNFFGDFTNRFWDCLKAVEGYEHYNLILDSASVYSTHQVVPLTPARGLYGFQTQTSRYRRIEMMNNQIYNTTYGISLHTTPGIGATPSYAGPIKINYNTIAASVNTTVNVLNEYMYRAIAVENLNNPISPIGNRVQTNGNLIRWVKNGIYMANFNQQIPESDSNTVSIVRDLDSAYTQKGIEHANSSHDFISNNEVFSVNYNVPNVNPAGYTGSILVGIRESGDQLFTVGCNRVHDINSGFEFYQDYNHGRWGQNVMRFNKFGYVLKASVIGDQLDATHPMHNYWTPGTMVYETFSVNNVAPPTWPQLSRLFVIGPPGGGFNPAVNGNWPLASIPYAIANGSIVPTVNGPIGDCHSLEVNGPAALMRSLPEKSATKQIPYTGSVQKKDWIAQYSTYQETLVDSELVDSSAILQQFKTMAENSRFHHLRCIEDKIASGDLIVAQTLLNAPTDSLANTSVDTVTGVQMADDTAADDIVSNYKLYYNLYLKYASKTMTGTDSALVEAMANLCPMIDGSVVYQARSLYSLISQNMIVFSDDFCDSVLSSPEDTTPRMRPANIGNAISDRNMGQLYSLYPNPTDGDINLEQLIADDRPVKAKIWNVSGQTIYLKDLKFNNNRTKIFQNLTPGMYAMELTDAQGRTFILKFVVK